MALESAMKTMMGYEHPIVPPPEDYKGDFFADIQNALVGVGMILREDSIYQLDKDYNNLSKFLNRFVKCVFGLKLCEIDFLEIEVFNYKKLKKNDRKILCSVAIFSFRILGMPVELQNRLFKYFTDTLAAIISQAKRTGKYDMGILGKCYFSTHVLDIVHWFALFHI